MIIEIEYEKIAGIDCYRINKPFSSSEFMVKPELIKLLEEKLEGEMLTDKARKKKYPHIKKYMGLTPKSRRTSK